MQRLTCGIVVYDEALEVKKLISKLKTELIDYQVSWIFVLNHREKSTRQQLSETIRGALDVDQAQFSDNSCIIENTSNNIGLARQLILERSTTDWVYFTDPDIEMNSNSLRLLIEASIQTPTGVIGLGGPALYQSSNPFLRNTFHFLNFISRYTPFAFQTQSHKRNRSVDHLPTCHLLLNRTAALKVGGFASRFFSCGEDLDFTHRATNAGYQFLFLSSAPVTHWQNISARAWFKKIFLFGRVQIFAQKQNAKGGLRIYRLMPLAALLLACVFFAAFTFKFSQNLLQIGIAIGILASLAALVKGLYGALLTIMVYATGELAELIVPIFVCKSVQESPAQRPEAVQPNVSAKNHT